MQFVIPNGFLTLLEAADFLLPFKFAGKPDSPEIIKARQQGIDAYDGHAMASVIGDIWQAVDERKLTPYAVASPREPMRLDPALTKMVPGLRSPRGGDFTFLRRPNPAFLQVTNWFNCTLSNIRLVLLEVEIRKFGQILKRRAKGGSANKRGRKSLIPKVQTIIRDIVERGTWKTADGIKALTYRIGRSGGLKISPDTAVRALDDLYASTRDRRFQRAHRRPRRS